MLPPLNGGGPAHAPTHAHAHAHGPAPAARLMCLFCVLQTSWQPLPTLSVDGVRRQHLPQPSGPHSVGFVDLLTPGPPSEGTLARLLYPTSEQCLGEPGRWPAWAEDRYLSGMLSFMQSVLARWPSWAPRSEYYGMERLRPLSPYLPRAGFPALFRAFVGRVHVPIVEGAAPLEADDEGGWPLVVFSHGLGCARSTYSRVCYDLVREGMKKKMHTRPILPEYRRIQVSVPFPRPTIRQNAEVGIRRNRN